MSQALAQSATQLSASSPKEVNYQAIISKNALRSAKGVTRERMMLNNSKLFSICADEIRSLLGQEKGIQLPKEVADKLHNEIDEFVQKQINRINPQNILSFRRSFFADFRNLRVTDRLTSVGENVLALKEQHLGVNILLTEANKRLDDLMKKPNPDYDMEASQREKINKLGLIKTHIETCLASLDEKK